MTAYVEEQHMALGRGEVSCDWDEEVHAEFVDTDGRLKKWMHAEIRDANDELICPPMVIVGKEAGKEGITLGLTGLAWWQGSGNVGPLIVDRKYASGVSRLSNGGFELDNLYWVLPEADLWIVVGVGARTGSLCIVHANQPPGKTTSDVLASEDRVTDMVAGETWKASAWVKSGITFGGWLRVRLVCEGSFTHPNLFPPFSLWGPSSSFPADLNTASTDPAGILAGAVFRAHNTRWNRIPNGDFDIGADFNGWTQNFGVWVEGHGGGINGPDFVATQSNFGILESILHLEVTEGEEYEFSFYARGTHNQADPDGTVWMSVAMNSTTRGQVLASTQRSSASAHDVGVWQYLTGRLTVENGVYELVPAVVVTDRTQGEWNADAVWMVRTRGNFDARESPAIAITPERTYEWRVPFRVDPNITGSLHLRMRCTRPGHADVILPGTTISGSDEYGEQIAVATFTPPSGYTTGYLQLYSEDVFWGYITVSDEATLFDTDGSTKVFDAIGPASAAVYTEVAVTATVPGGTTSMHWEAHAETGAGEWLLDDAGLTHLAPPVTSAQVVASLLLDPDTGAPLPVVAGTIVGAETIPYDWHVYNLTNHDALEHFSRVVASPPREWRVNNDRTLDWDVAEDLFVDHAPGTASEIIFVDGSDVDIAVPRTSEDTTDRPTKVRLIGAERKYANGQNAIIAASAEVPGTEVDYLGNPANRSLLIEDSTVNHYGYAAALLTDQVTKLAEPPQNVTVTLKGLSTRPPHGVGDWLYVYKPDAGLTTDPASTPVAMVEGEATWPVGKRLLGRTRRLGTSHRIVIRRLDGTTFDLGAHTRIRWETDVTTLELGERPYEFAADSQGGDVGIQFLRSRASAPR